MPPAKRNKGNRGNMLHIQVSLTESVTVVTDVTALEGGGTYQKRA